MSKKFPETIEVRFEDEGDRPFLIADMEMAVDGDRIGIYKLVEVKMMKITKELV